MDRVFIRRAPTRLLVAVVFALSAGGAAAQTTPDPAKKNTEQTAPKEPSAPTAKMESPEVPKPQSAEDRSKAPPGTPHPPEQPYPSKAKEK